MIQPQQNNIKNKENSSQNGLSAVIEEQIREYYQAHEGLLPANGVYHRLIREFEIPIIKVTLEAVQGNQKKAAEILGINRNTLRRKMIDLGLIAEI